MAKGKAIKSSKAQTVPAKRKMPTPKTGAIATREKNVTATASVFTGISIGHAAGEVWGLLSGGEPRTIAEIKKSVNAPGDVVVAAIGWLAREDKLDFVTNGKIVKIGLR